MLERIFRRDFLQKGTSRSACATKGEERFTAQEPSGGEAFLVAALARDDNEKQRQRRNREEPTLENEGWGTRKT